MATMALNSIARDVATVRICSLHTRGPLFHGTDQTGPERTKSTHYFTAQTRLDQIHCILRKGSNMKSYKKTCVKYTSPDMLLLNGGAVMRVLLFCQAEKIGLE